jgi:hypothetical protein
MSDNGYDRVVKDFAKFLIDNSENGSVSVMNIPGYVKEWCDNMHEQTKLERDRITNIIHDYCRGDTMLGKGCASCVLNELNVCGSTSGMQTPMSRLREAEKVINEVLANG